MTQPLSAREIDVLRRSCEGLHIKQIARVLGISPKTVATHRYRLTRKTGCKNAFQLAIWAVRNGIVDLEPQGASE